MYHKLEDPIGKETMGRKEEQDKAREEGEDEKEWTTKDRNSKGPNGEQNFPSVDADYASKGLNTINNESN